MSINEILDLRAEKEMYRKGFELLLEYWDCLPDEDKDEIDGKLVGLGL